MSHTTGRQSSTIDSDFGLGTGYLYGTDNLYVLKVNAVGNYVWVKGFGTDGIKEIMGIKSDAHGNRTMTAITMQILTLIQDRAQIRLPCRHLRRCLHHQTRLCWKSSLGQGNRWYCLSRRGPCDHARSYGNALVTGQFASTVDFDPGPGTANERSTAGVEDIFVLKLDASGNYVWHAVMENGTGADKGYAIVTDRLGNVFTTGQFHATGDFDPEQAYKRGHRQAIKMLSCRY